MEVRYEITFEICNTVHPGDGCTVRFWQYGSKCCWRNISLGHYQLNFPGWRSHGQYWRGGITRWGRPYYHLLSWPRALLRLSSPQPCAALGGAWLVTPAVLS